MKNQIILEGIITQLEYGIPSQNELFATGAISTPYKENRDAKLVLYFHIEGVLAIEYYKLLKKNTKVILEGRLEFVNYVDNNISRYSMNVRKIKILEEHIKKTRKFSILYSNRNNSFSIDKI